MDIDPRGIDTTMTGTAAAATSVSAARHSLASSYVPAPSTHDEMLAHDGTVRPHWHGVLAALENLPPEERLSRAEKLRRRVRATGIAYDIFAEPNLSRQRWTLDLVPLVISAGEWRWLERALIQRARLFAALLDDIYGSQALMTEGRIPPALVFADPTFLRACHGIRPGRGHLHFYAADLARDAQGRWRVLDNHAETPAGAGFALANRVVHTHVAGDLFKAGNVMRVAAFYQALQASLARLCGRADPRVAMLSPGPHHEDYFSHAYLARYLGYLLVEGGDLRITSNRVFLKTLEGLKDVDLIVRCIEGRAADPLELDPKRFDGPVGWTAASRATPDIAVNGLGSAVVQNRGLGPYLADLCRHVLGEDLLLEDAPRQWLGNPEAGRHALANLDTLVIRPSQEGTGRPGQATVGHDPATATPETRRKIMEDIRLSGARLVAEERLSFGTSPVLTDQGLVAQHFAMRLFSARMADGFAVMPGGLAMTVDPTRAVAMTSPEGATRDVWVLSDAQLPPHVSLWRPALETARVQRSQRVTQSRVADNLFWLGRYAERADWFLRVLRSALQGLREDNGPANVIPAARTCLQTILANDKTLKLSAALLASTAGIEPLMRALMSAPQGRRTLDRTLDNLHRTATLTRDRLSFEAWRTLNFFRPRDDWRRALLAAEPGVMLDLIEEGLGSIAAFNGLMHENMTRNFGWTFTDMGRRIERAANLAEAVLALFVPKPHRDEDPGDLYFLLELADSHITYRSRYRLDPLPPLVLDLLLLDETNPRSLAFQLAAVARHLEDLPKAKSGASLPEERRINLALLTAIRLADVEGFAREGGRDKLEALLAEEVRLLPELSDAIARRYFSLTEDRPQRVHTRVEPKI